MALLHLFKFDVGMSVGVSIVEMNPVNRTCDPGLHER